MIKQNFVIEQFGFPDEIRKLDFIGLGLRKNPKRSQLYISELLGKHIPQNPEKIVNHAKALAKKIEASDFSILREKNIQSVIIGFSETATALSEIVAKELKLPYITTTRYPREYPSFSFSEEHSHAVEQVLAPSEEFLQFMKEKPLHLIFVDDEMSTGKTFINALKAMTENAELIIKSATFASLLSTVDSENNLRFVELEKQFQLDNLSVIALYTQQIQLPEQFHKKAQKFVEEHKDNLSILTDETSSFITLEFEETQVSSRGMITHENNDSIDGVAKKLDEKIKDMKNKFEQDILYIVGTEEFMFLPLQLAQVLKKNYPMTEIRYSSTTRSPIMVINQEDYPIKMGVTKFSADGISRFLYNIPQKAPVIFVNSSKATESQKEFSAHLLSFYTNSIGVII